MGFYIDLIVTKRGEEENTDAASIENLLDLAALNKYLMEQNVISINPVRASAIGPDVFMAGFPSDSIYSKLIGKGIDCEKIVTAINLAGSRRSIETDTFIRTKPAVHRVIDYITNTVCENLPSSHSVIFCLYMQTDRGDTWREPLQSVTGGWIQVIKDIISVKHGFTDFEVTNCMTNQDPSYGGFDPSPAFYVYFTKQGQTLIERSLSL